MHPHLIIRKGLQNDISELQKLFVETITTICIADYNKQQIEAWISSVKNNQRWHEIIIQQFVLIAQRKNKILGFVTLDNKNHVDFLYIHKDYQRQGIASKLYAKIEDEAKQLKQSELTANVSKTARAFFEKNGFKVLKKQKVNINGIKLTNYKMTKSLVI